MVQYGLRRGWLNSSGSSSKRMWKPCSLQNFTHIWISLHFITFLLPRGQMGADEAEGCLVQCHTDGYRSLLTHHKNIIWVQLEFDNGTMLVFLVQLCWPCCLGTPWRLSRHWRPSDSRRVCKDLLEPTHTRKCPPSACLQPGNTAAALDYLARMGRFRQHCCRRLKRASPRSSVLVSGWLRAGRIMARNYSRRSWGPPEWGRATGRLGHCPPPQAHCLHLEGRFLGTYWEIVPKVNY